jgi:carbonic anhydrase/acetyltransferase-like protein (isoleucine patch superfamily)
VNNTNATSPYNVTTSGSYTILATDSKGCTASKQVTIKMPVANTSSISISNSNVYCNSLNLTATSTSTGPYTYEWFGPANTLIATSQTLNLNNTNTDGNYSVYVTDANKCRSTSAAVYNYLKQNILGNYTVLGLKDVILGQGNIVNGAVGNTYSGRKVIIDKNSTVNGFVKASVISLTSPVTVTGGLFYIPATVVLPTMQTNAATLPKTNFTVADNATTTVSTNYNDLIIGKAATVTVSGTIYGKITIGEGAKVTFTQNTIDINTLILIAGKLNANYTTATFNGSNIRIKTSVKVGDRCRVNGNNTTFFVSDPISDVEKFTINSNDTRFNANVYMPKGKLQVSGTVGNVIMTGIFIAEDIASNIATTWNGNNCVILSVARNQSNINSQSEINTENSSFDVNVSPNPSKNDFYIQIKSERRAPATIRILNTVGSLQSVMKINDPSTKIKVGEKLLPGTYFAEITQGKEKKVVKLIKLN